MYYKKLHIAINLPQNTPPNIKNIASSTLPFSSSAGGQLSCFYKVSSRKKKLHGAAESPQQTKRYPVCPSSHHASDLAV